MLYRDADNKVAPVAADKPAVPDGVNDLYRLVPGTVNGETVNRIQITILRRNRLTQVTAHRCYARPLPCSLPFSSSPFRSPALSRKCCDLNRPFQL